MIGSTSGETNLSGHCYRYWVPAVSSIVAAECAAHSLVASLLETYQLHSLVADSESLRIGAAAVAVDPGTVVVAAAVVAAFVASCYCPCQEASAQRPEEPKP